MVTFLVNKGLSREVRRDVVQEVSAIVTGMCEIIAKQDLKEIATDSHG